MAIHSWDDRQRTTIFLEKRHIEALEKVAQEARISRQWALREILESVFSREGGPKITQATVEI